MILWILSWSLSCIYFAGEEANWGQWYFNWETPEFINGIHDQGETNLHNMSSWLDQKPRTLVELFIFTIGFMIPIYRTTVTAAGWTSVSDHPCFQLVALSFFKNMGNRELREFAIAWFLVWYLSSYYVRLKTLSEMSKADYRLKVFSNAYTRSRA